MKWRWGRGSSTSEVEVGEGLIYNKWRWGEGLIRNNNGSLFERLLQFKTLNNSMIEILVLTSKKLAFKIVHT